jgi:hypothetical protein
MAPKGGEDDVTRNPRRMFSSGNRTTSSTTPRTLPVGPRGFGMVTRPPAIVETTEGQIGQNRTEKELTESPTIAQNESWAPRAPSSGPERRSKPSKRPIPLTIGRPTTPENVVPPSPSRARWEHLRQHVLPIPIRPATPPATPPHTTPPHQTHTLPPPRSQTPKPSRLARLGFRQVVEQAREVALDDARRFAHELQKVCWSIRFVAPERVKVDREPATMGSTLHLPFISNGLLASTSAASVDSHPGRKQEIRRPQSIPALATAYRAVPSLKPLYHVLLHHATPSSDGTFPLPSLPNELQVLSALLSPFMTSERGSHLEGERSIALDSFDIIIRTWAPMDQVSAHFSTLTRS